MLDLMVLAFQTDATRVGTFMFANDVSGRNFSSFVDGVHAGINWTVKKRPLRGGVAGLKMWRTL